MTGGQIKVVTDQGFTGFVKIDSRVCLSLQVYPEATRECSAIPTASTLFIVEGSWGDLEKVPIVSPE